MQISKSFQAKVFTIKDNAFGLRLRNFVEAKTFLLCTSPVLCVENRKLAAKKNKSSAKGCRENMIKLLFERTSGQLLREKAIKNL